jgi:hypothetical protein
MLQQYQGRGREIVQAAMGGKAVSAESDEHDDDDDDDDGDAMDAEEQAGLDIVDMEGEAVSPDGLSGYGEAAPAHKGEGEEEAVIIPRRKRPKHRTQAKRMPEHEFLDNGLLRVNPAGQHPIFDLVEYSQLAWRNKTEKASKTLKEAVDEYRRRYGRAPPRGFDRW